MLESKCPGITFLKISDEYLSLIMSGKPPNTNSTCHANFTAVLGLIRHYLGANIDIQLNGSDFGLKFDNASLPVPNIRISPTKNFKYVLLT